MTNKEAAFILLRAFEYLSKKYDITANYREAFTIAVGKLMNGEEDNEDCCE